MSDDLLKRARAQIVEGEEYVASIGGKVIQQGFMPLLCDRIEELTEQLAAEKGKVAALEWFAEISADEAFAVFSRVVGEAESHE